MIFLFQEFVKGSEIRHIFSLDTEFVFHIAATTVTKSKSTSSYKLVRACTT